MKYEFMSLSEDFRKNSNNLYENDNGDFCINLRETMNKNTRLKSPIAIFINGILLESSEYSFERDIVTIKNSYSVKPTDRIYIIFISTDPEKSGFITHLNIHDFEVIDEDTILSHTPIKSSFEKEVIAIVINGILYSNETFEIKDDTITFTSYRPSKGSVNSTDDDNMEDISIDDVSVLILERN